MALMFLMQLGEIVFGGVGSGLYGMLAFVILTVFIAGLMVGRTPEYLGKKVEPFDMKMVCLIILGPPLLSLLGTFAAVLMPQVSTWLANSGAHGFSEILYAFTSMGNNNGSAFAGFASNTVFTNITGGMIMLAVRFVPMLAVIFLAGNLADKKIIAAGRGNPFHKQRHFYRTADRDHIYRWRPEFLSFAGAWPDSRLFYNGRLRK